MIRLKFGKERAWVGGIWRKVVKLDMIEAGAAVVRNGRRSSNPDVLCTSTLEDIGTHENKEQAAVPGRQNVSSRKQGDSIEVKLQRMGCSSLLTTNNHGCHACNTRLLALCRLVPPWQRRRDEGYCMIVIAE